MPPKSTPMTQAAIRRMIKESVDAAIAAERKRQANVINDASGSGPVRGQDTTPAVRECTFAGFMKCNPAVFRGVDRNVKEYDVVAYTQRFNELALMCPRMVEPERVKVDAYIQGLTDNIMGEVTSSKPADLNEAMRMAHKLMEKKLIAKSKEMSEHWLPLLLMESFLCVNNVLLTMWVSVRSSAISVEKLGTRQGHTRNRCPKKIKQEEVGEVRVELILLRMLNLKSFVNTRFSSFLDIKPIKIEDSYEVELADGRIVSTDIVLKGGTLNLVNHIFEIDLMPIELGTFDVIIGMDWLVKNDAVIVFGEKVIRILYGISRDSRRR
ncbi:reverse transcriptase domain-containing protein [Tanacetum coccineum]